MVAPPSFSSLDINGSYSRWQLVQVLLGGVSLVSVLISISHSSFKKVNDFILENFVGVVLFINFDPVFHYNGLVVKMYIYM